MARRMAAFASDDFDDDDGRRRGMIPVEESTSFDDVALSLLLFFMVMSLFASFQSSKSASGDAVTVLPVAGGVLDLGEEEGRARVELTADEEVLKIVHVDENGETRRESPLPLADASGAALKDAIMAVVMEAQERPLRNPGRDGLYVVANLPRSLRYETLLGVWYGLAAVHRKNEAFQQRVAMVSWSSESMAQGLPGGE